MSGPLLLRAAQFQAAWYFSLLLAVMLLLVVVGTGYVLLGARTLWRSGEHGPAAVLIGAALLGLVGLVSMYAVGIGGLLIKGAGP